MLPQVIGLSGCAGAGKDTFFEIFRDKMVDLGIPVQRFALADDLKNEMFQFIRHYYGIDIFTCSRAEKDLVRPILVAHGKIMREKTKGQHWWKTLNPKVLTFINENPTGIAVITDIRYNQYPEDECHWIKKILNGKLVHISAYNMINSHKAIVRPANKEEEENDPKLSLIADAHVYWPVTNGDKNPLTPFVSETVARFYGAR